jgi:soluble lytic murein transglycosylase-like protein
MLKKDCIVSRIKKTIFTIRMKPIKAGVFLVFALTLLFVPSAICGYQLNLWDIRASAYDLLSKPNQTRTKHLLGAEKDARDAKTGLKSRDAAARTPSAHYRKQILRAARNYDVDPALIKAIIQVESNYNPRAVSHCGARGLMQLMPATARWLGIEDSFDPASNIDGGVRYIKHLLEQFDDDVVLALAAYNAGSRHVRRYKGVPPFPTTRMYIKKVLKFRNEFEAQLASPNPLPSAS